MDSPALAYCLLFALVLLGAGTFVHNSRQKTELRRQQQQAWRLRREDQAAIARLRALDRELTLPGSSRLRAPLPTAEQIKERYVAAIAASPIHLEFLSLFRESKSPEHLAASPRNWNAELQEDCLDVTGKLTNVGLLRQADYAGRTHIFLTERGASILAGSTLAAAPPAQPATRELATMHT